MQGWISVTYGVTQETASFVQRWVSSAPPWRLLCASFNISALSSWRQSPRASHHERIGALCRARLYFIYLSDLSCHFSSCVMQARLWDYLKEKSHCREVSYFDASEKNSRNIWRWRRWVCPRHWNTFIRTEVAHLVDSEIKSSCR